MKIRDFLRLPLGEFTLKDEIYKYSLSKSLTRDGSPMYSIKEGVTGRNLCLFEYKEDDEEKDNWLANPRTCLSVFVSVGSFLMSSNDLPSNIYRVKIQPRGSFKEFLNRTKPAVDQLMAA